MAATAEVDPQPVFRLIYSSRSRIEAQRSDTELAEILTTARRNNRRLGITGALLIADGAFVQTLEGDEDAVRGLYETISGDARHAEVTLLHTDTVAGRAFGRWAMAKVAAEGGPDIRLLSNADKGRLVLATPDPHVTEEQEAVLRRMRVAVTGEAADARA